MGTAFENLRARQSIISPEATKKVSAFDTLKQRQDLITTQEKPQEEKDGFFKSLVKAPLTTIARPFQLGAELLMPGDNTEAIDKFSKEKLGGFVAPVPQNFSDVKKDVGRGIQTAAFGLPGLASGGAAFGLGASLEQGSDLFSKETALATGGGAVAGKLLGFVGKPLINAAGKVVGKITPQIVKDVSAQGAKAVEDFMARHQILPKEASQAITTGANRLESVIDAPFKLPGKLAKNKALNNIESEVESLLNKNKGVLNKTQLADRKNVPLKEILSEPSVFKGLKVENTRINPDEAIGTIVARKDALLEAKRAILPEIERYTPKTSREVIRKKALQDIKGKYAPADEADLVKSINKQVDALDKELSASEIDSLRARFRKSARDAKGLQKSNSEYTALENASRDTVFDITDNLPFDTNKEFQAINNTIKDLIETETFLDKTIRGQVVKGGRLTNLFGRGIGAIAGSKFGIMGSLGGSEVGGIVANIITNNQLGSSFKMRLIREITDNPAIIKKAQEILSKSIGYKPPQLSAPSSKFRTQQGSGKTINLGAKSTSTLEKEEMTRIQGRLSQGIETKPKDLSNIQTAISKTPIKGISNKIAQLKPKVKPSLDLKSLQSSKNTSITKGKSQALGDKIETTGEQKPTIKLKRDVQITTLSGEKTMIDSGEVLKAYESGGKALLKDGREYIVSKSQYENIKNNSLKSEAKEFAPELKGVEESVRGGSDLEARIDSLLDDEVGQGMTRKEAKEFILNDAEDTVATKYESYQLPDGKNYKEVLIKAPENIGKPNAEAIAKLERERRNFGRSSIAYQEKTKQIDELRRGVEGSFKSSHWDEPNVISHLRLNERTYKGKKVTFMEELQSDWAREGRSKGFFNKENVKIERKDIDLEKTTDKGDITYYHLHRGVDEKLYSIKAYSEAQAEQLALKMNEKLAGGSSYKKEIGNQVIFDATKTKVPKYDVVIDGEIKNSFAKETEANYYIQKLSKKQIPSNPLLKNWQELSVKRGLKEAVDNNSEYFAWINGEQTSARYNLATKLDNGEWADNLYGTPVKKGQVGNIVEDVTGGKVVKLDMGLPIKYETQWKLGTTDKLAKVSDLKVGQEVYQVGNSKTDYIITDILGDGKFKAMKKLLYDGIEEGMNKPSMRGMTRKQIIADQAETFDISTKKTTQQGIELTPEIKAIIRGEAPKI